jgi:hypothetical protein
MATINRRIAASIEIYNNMPLRGLAKASTHIDAVGRAGTAMGRLMMPLLA